MIILMTGNLKKLDEYRRFFGRHSQMVRVEEFTENVDVLFTWLTQKAVRGILADESNIYTPEGDLVRATYVGHAKNICRLHAWVMQDGVVIRRSYVRMIDGVFDGALFPNNDPQVFGWDAAFRSFEAASLHDMAVVGLKNSAREQCLSAFVREYLRYSEPKMPTWIDIEVSSIIDWSLDANLIFSNPLYRDLPFPLHNALAYVVNRGLFFRSSHSRRDGNYWLPGLNGGVPFVPKGDPVHESTYLFHDLMHQLIPDLVFDGVQGPIHRRVYIISRMMSEAISLVLADMLFVDVIRQHEKDYDVTKRHIYPLYQTMKENIDLRSLLKRMVYFTVLGDTSGFPIHTDEWRRFEDKYTKFFVGDFQWTRMNWDNLIGRSDAMRRWIQLVTPRALKDQGVWLVSDVVDIVGSRETSLYELVDILFELLYACRIAPAFNTQESIDVEQSCSSGFRRWLTGQCALFARYAPLVGVPDIAYRYASRILDSRPFSRSEIMDTHGQFKQYVEEMARTGVISDDDAFVFGNVFPLFDPFFLRDYDRSDQEFSSVAEASRKALL